MKIVLIGYRGSGKTSVARELAKRLRCEWRDADAELVCRAGKPIAEIFASDGEAKFRELESAVLLDLLQLDAAVLALGGGVVLREENRAALRASGAKVIWLTASAETLAARIAADKESNAQRPNLTAAGGLAEVCTMLAQREPLYREVANFVVDTEEKTPREIAAELEFRL